MYPEYRRYHYKRRRKSYLTALAPLLLALTPLVAFAGIISFTWEPIGPAAPFSSIDTSGQSITFAMLSNPTISEPTQISIFATIEATDGTTLQGLWDKPIQIFSGNGSIEIGVRPESADPPIFTGNMFSESFPTSNTGLNPTELTGDFANRYTLEIRWIFQTGAYSTSSTPYTLTFSE